MEENNGIGLVLCGGGGKGAFQIGVWKALEEYGLLQKITAISGTSVGALNAVLFGLEDYNLAKETWMSLQTEDLLQLKTDGLFEVGKIITGESSLFSRKGLEQSIDKIPLENLQQSRMKIFVNIFNTEKKTTEAVYINELPRKEIKALLLASSAIPIIYTREEYKGTYYEDGGVSDLGNVPVGPLYKNGFRNFVIVSLDSDFNLSNVKQEVIYKISNHRVDFYNYYANSKFEVISPLENIGGLLSGTLNFQCSSVCDKIVEGYISASKILERKVYVMKNSNSRINIQIRKEVSDLFNSAEEFEGFVKTTHFSNVNIDMATMGGTIWYENIVEVFGWKIQQHKLPGMKNHYRILDSNNIRRAWVMDPEDILEALQTYRAAKKTELI